MEIKVRAQEKIHQLNRNAYSSLIPFLKNKCTILNEAKYMYINN